MTTIKQTDDKELLAEIIRQLKEHNNHCPCQFDDTSPDTLCMCADFKKMIDTNISGEYECPCGRYIATISNE